MDGAHPNTSQFVCPAVPLCTMHGSIFATSPTSHAFHALSGFGRRQAKKKHHPCRLVRLT